MDELNDEQKQGAWRRERDGLEDSASPNLIDFSQQSDPSDQSTLGLP
jgi:hypothetical protein